MPNVEQSYSKASFVVCFIAFGLSSYSLNAQIFTPADQMPKIKTPAPVIYLSNNLDEKDKLGYCIDTVGRGLSDRLHLHSCKPQGGDVQFSYDMRTGQIRSAIFDNLCAEIASKEVSSSDATMGNLKLVRCQNSIMQKFTYDEHSAQFRTQGIDNFCLASSGDSRKAGPFMARDLVIGLCTAIPTHLKSWTILE